MNKKAVLNKVKEELKLNDKELEVFASISERYPLLGKKNKSRMLSAFIDEMNVDENTAEKYYETLSSIIMTCIKEKIKHPFKNLDK